MTKRPCWGPSHGDSVEICRQLKATPGIFTGLPRFFHHLYSTIRNDLLRRVIRALRKFIPKFVRKTHVFNMIRVVLLPKDISQPNFSIGIFTGTSPINLGPSDNIKNPVLTAADVTDVPAVFIADPFMIKKDATWYMFAEVFNAKTLKGEIAMAKSEDGFNWLYDQIVLAEPFHLSYPYVFEWMNDYYMIPESQAIGEVRLYKAHDFFTKWSFIKILIAGKYDDSSIFYYNQTWWLFTAKGHDSLYLFFADDLMGPWMPHPQNPLVSGDPHFARPGGRVLVIDGKIIRFAQDDAPDYGLKVHAFEVTQLSAESYEEKIIGESLLQPSGHGWNATGMHHLDAHRIMDNQWLACVDGWDRRVKLLERR